MIDESEGLLNNRRTVSTSRLGAEQAEPPDDIAYVQSWTSAEWPTLRTAIPGAQWMKEVRRGRVRTTIRYKAIVVDTD